VIRGMWYSLQEYCYREQRYVGFTAEVLLPRAEICGIHCRSIVAASRNIWDSLQEYCYRDQRYVGFTAGILLPRAEVDLYGI
jgi:hypothetical protein